MKQICGFFKDLCASKVRVVEIKLHAESEILQVTVSEAEAAIRKLDKCRGENNG